ncbi:fasciclin domain-containing protein, partial [Streptomyces sp. SID11233]|nr:fasciclin domain-containing protein [Streptomyces sp. SID11233]
SDNSASDSASKGSSASSSSKGASDEASSPAAGQDQSMDEAGPFGPGCAGVPKSGAGSFDGMAQDPVATAASNNPALSTLVTAVKKAGLVDTLNNAKNITVFA